MPPEKLDKLTLKKKYTKAEFRKQAADILLRLQTELSPFPDDLEARRERLNRSKDDAFYFFQTYLPHYFSTEFAPFHYKLVELLDQRPDAEEVLIPVVVAAPREFAKTTITSFGYALHQICHNLRHFIIIGSDTEDLASDLTGYIYLELLYNERLRADFGELVRDNVAVDDFVTANDVRLKARGRGQRLRGLKHKQWRPDLVILDDLENDKNVKNPRLVKELLDWIKNTVYPGIDASGNLFIIGTILARRSALDIMLKGEEEPWQHWRRSLYRAIENGDSIWPARHPLTKLLQQKKLMGSLAFNREKMNDPVDEEGMFREGWIRYYHPAELPDGLAVAGWLDPSVEVKASADFKAILTVGLDLKDMIIYVLDAFIRRVSIEQCLAAAYIRHNQYGFKVFGVEDNLFQKLLIREFDREALERKQYLPIKGLTNTLNKETRISGLSPLVERGKIRFARGHSDQDLLVEQLLAFPSPTVNDDGPDALEGAVRLVQEFGLAHIEYESVQERRWQAAGAY
jgi:predicted phage terminase large subunit-like protein